MSDETIGRTPDWREQAGNLPSQPASPSLPIGEGAEKEKEAAKEPSAGQRITKQMLKNARLARALFVPLPHSTSDPDPDYFSEPVGVEAPVTEPPAHDEEIDVLIFESAYDHEISGEAAKGLRRRFKAAVVELRAEVSRLKAENERLREQNSAKEAIRQLLDADVAALKGERDTLREGLKAILADTDIPIWLIPRLAALLAGSERPK